MPPFNFQVEPMYRPLIVSVAELTDGSVDIYVVNDHRERREGLKVRTHCL